MAWQRKATMLINQLVKFIGEFIDWTGESVTRDLNILKECVYNGTIQNHQQFIDHLTTILRSVDNPQQQSDQDIHIVILKLESELNRLLQKYWSKLDLSMNERIKTKSLDWIKNNGYVKQLKQELDQYKQQNKDLHKELLKMLVQKKFRDKKFEQVTSRMHRLFYELEQCKETNRILDESNQIYIANLQQVAVLKIKNDKLKELLMKNEIEIAYD